MNQGQEIRSSCLNQDSEMNGFWLRVGSFDGLGGTPLPKLPPPPPPGLADLSERLSKV